MKQHISIHINRSKTCRLHSVVCSTYSSVQIGASMVTSETIPDANSKSKGGRHTFG